MEFLLRLLMNRVMGHLIHRGIDRIATGNRPPETLTKEERQQRKAARQTLRKARQAGRIAFRLWR